MFFKILLGDLNAPFCVSSARRKPQKILLLHPLYSTETPVSYPRIKLRCNRTAIFEIRAPARASKCLPLMRSGKQGPRNDKRRGGPTRVAAQASSA